MERKLATIQTIGSLEPIAGADKIEKATVMGWECVVKKHEFQVGEKVIYIEVDSVLPDKPEYEFLRDRKFRIRTIKLKGQISQGLILPMSVLPNANFKIGDDVTTELGITKYLTPSEQIEIAQQYSKKHNIIHKTLMRYKWYRTLMLKRKSDGGFPRWIAKTDEERIQNIPQVLSDFSDRLVYVTEKIDYQSVTFSGKLVPYKIPVINKLLPKKFKFVVCSRNSINTNTDSLYWKIAKKYHLDDILKYNPTLTIQGEQGNTNVQSNKYGITEPMLWVFNIIDHERKYQFDYDEMAAFCEKWGLTPVPLIAKCKLADIATNVADIVEYSKAKSVLADIQREGVVIRCIENGKKILSFKVINPIFLLNYNN